MSGSKKTTPPRRRTQGDSGRRSGTPGKLDRLDPRRLSRVYRHPDSEVIQTLLLVWSTKKISRWLSERFPERDPSTGALLRENRELRISKRGLDDHIDSFLRPKMPDGWVPPMDSGNPLENELPVRLPSDDQLMELLALERAIEAAEATLARCLRHDKVINEVSPTTIEAQKSLAEIAEKRAILAARLGIDGYELVPEKSQIQVDQRTLSLQGTIDMKPLQPEKIDLAKRLLELPAKKRKALMAADLKRVEPAKVLDDVVLDDSSDSG